MSSYEEKQEKWTKIYYESLIGFTCVDVEAKTDDMGNCWPVLIFELNDKNNNIKAEIEVSCDEEGNRPGFLFGLPVVPDGINPFLVD